MVVVLSENVNVKCNLVSCLLVSKKSDTKEPDTKMVSQF